MTVALAIEAELSEKYRAQFALARRVNNQCHHLLFGVPLTHNDGHGLAVAIMFLRALQHYQAAIILLSKGMVAAATASIRAQLEAIFTLKAMAADDKNYRDFVISDRTRRLKIARIAHQYPQYPILSKVRGAFDDEAIATLTREVKESSSKELSTEEMARRAGLHDVYTSLYRLFSSAVHTGPKEMDAHLILNDNDDIGEIAYHPATDETPSLLMTAADLLLLGSDGLCSYFSNESFGETRRELSELIAAQFPDDDSGTPTTP